MYCIFYVMQDIKGNGLSLKVTNGSKDTVPSGFDYLDMFVPQ